jgi:hypothetical protein
LASTKEITRMRTALIALALTLSAPAGAAELLPNHAHSIDLNGVVGVAYYTVDAGEFRLVAVLAAGEAATPFRFSSSLAAGQRIAVSVPGMLGTQEAAIEFVRQGNTVLASPVLVALN